MERKIGEVFEYQGKKLRVQYVPEENCKGCFFDGICTDDARELTGECDMDKRNDNSYVVFVKTEDAPTEQPAPQEAQKLNLLEILKNCPRDTLLWSPMMGDLRFKEIKCTMIRTYHNHNEIFISFFPDGTMSWGAGLRSLDCMLFPSREQRDWSKVHFETPVEKLPKSWREFCETHEVQKGEAYLDDCCNILGEEEIGDTRDVSNDKNILPSEQACRQHLALMQLHQLRDCWRQGWKPEINKKHWSICRFLTCTYEASLYNNVSKFLTFQDKERAEKFLECFRDLIKGAGDLI